MTELNDHATRAHALLSASSAYRWSRCPASARIAAAYPRQDTVFTAEGTLAHEVAEALARFIIDGGTFPEFPEDVPEEMKKHGLAYAEYVAECSSGGSTVMLEQRVDFSPWVPEGFGTADCIILHGDVLEVIDYKYGQGVEVSAERNPQMMLYGLGAVNEYGFVYDVEKVRLHIFQPRKDNISVYETTRADLLTFGDEIAKAADMALSSPEMEAGDHCKFCPHAGRCPELAVYCMGATQFGYELCPDVKILTPAAVGRLLEFEPTITAWLKAVRTRALVDMQNGDSIPGFKVVAGKMGNRKWSDELQVAAALEAAGVPREDYTTLQLLSPAAMDKALGKKRAAELVGAFINREPGAPAIAPETDKRPALDKNSLADDFKE